MRQVALVAWFVLEVWVICAISRAVISWFPLSYGSIWHRVNSILVRVTEPVIAPVRRLLPPMRMGGVGLDLSFLIVVIVVQLLLTRVLGPYAFA